MRTLATAIFLLALAGTIWLAVEFTPMSEEPEALRMRMKEIRRYAGETSETITAKEKTP